MTSVNRPAEGRTWIPQLALSGFYGGSCALMGHVDVQRHDHPRQPAHPPNGPFYPSRRL